MSEGKPLPPLSSDDEADAFVGPADLTSYDLSVLKPTKFEFSSREAQADADSAPAPPARAAPMP